MINTEDAVKIGALNVLCLQLQYFLGLIYYIYNICSHLTSNIHMCLVCRPLWVQEEEL